MYNLVSGAAACGLNRSTILRAIKAGRLSAQRDHNGGWLIEPAELHRVFPPLPAAASEPTQQADAEVALLRNMLERMREDYLRREQNLRQDRDRWHAAYEATQRLLPAPALPRNTPADAGGPLYRVLRWMRKTG
jgi:hypothetical protein